MRAPFVRPMLCGLSPLTAGVVVWALWRVTRNDALTLAGMGLIGVGVIVSLIGAGWWIVDAIRLSRDRTLRSRAALARAALAVVLLVGCYPAAGAVVVDVVHVSTSYFVVVDNESGAAVTSCRVFGGGVDEELGPIAPGQSAEIDFRIAHDDELLCTIRTAEVTHDVVLDGYVTNSGGGTAHVTVAADGTPIVHGGTR